MNWIDIVGLIISSIYIAILCYNNHLQHQTQHLVDACLKELDAYEKALKSITDIQTKFNGSVTDNFERHEEAMRIIVNYIKAGENNV